MQPATAARVACLLALCLSPFTAYLAFIRPVPVPIDRAGAGLDNCGYVFYVLHPGPHPGSDLDAKPPCEQPRKDATLRFALLATVNGGLLFTAAGYGTRAWLNSRQDFAG